MDKETVIEKEHTYVRLLNSPIERVFQAWIKPEQLARWWGPADFTNPVCEIDPNPGGALRIDMRDPEGKIFPMTGLVLEVFEPERLVFISQPISEKGLPLFEVLNVITFKKENNKTKMKIEASVSKTAPGSESYLAVMDEGWYQSLGRLEKFLSAA